LKKTIARASLTFDELMTIMVENKGTLNNRPLTYVYNDTEGIHQPLTPADLIYGRRIATSLSDRQFEIVSTAKALTKRAKYQFQILSNFIKQWQKDYLLSLRERGSYICNLKTTGGHVVKEGDTVILKEDDTIQILWKIARFVETLKGRDGKIRAAKIKLMSNDKITDLRHPIQYLTLLEAD